MNKTIKQYKKKYELWIQELKRINSSVFQLEKEANLMARQSKGWKKKFFKLIAERFRTQKKLSKRFFKKKFEKELIRLSPSQPNKAKSQDSEKIFTSNKIQFFYFIKKVQKTKKMYFSACFSALNKSMSKVK